MNICFPGKTLTTRGEEKRGDHPVDDAPSTLQIRDS